MDCVPLEKVFESGQQTGESFGIDTEDLMNSIRGLLHVPRGIRLRSVTGTVWDFAWVHFD